MAAGATGSEGHLALALSLLDVGWRQTGEKGECKKHRSLDGANHLRVCWTRASSVVKSVIVKPSTKRGSGFHPEFVSVDFLPAEEPGQRGAA